MVKLGIQSALLLLYLLLGKSCGCQHERTENGSIQVFCYKISSLEQLPNWGKENNSLVQSLLISDSSLSVLPSSAFSKFPNLRTLNIRSNNLTEIEPGAFSGLDNLKELSLTKNLITELNEGVYNSLSNLTVLRLSENNIEEIDSAAFIGLGELHEIYLDGNNISIIEGDLFETQTKLEVLSFSRNPLTNFSANSLPKTLTQLFLIGCHLDNIDKWYFLPNVTKIMLNNNKFEALKGQFFSQTERLTTLSFSRNEISFIDVNYFQNLQFLEDLYLQGNRIQYIHPYLFRHLRNLKRLNLEKNKIETFRFGTFDNLVSLERLSFTRNHVRKLPQYTFHSLRSLIHLDFSYNKISTFNAEDLLKYLPKLKYVKLEGNPWNCEDVSHIYDVFKESQASLVYGYVQYKENVHGITCINKEKDTVLDEIVKYSEMGHLFNENFKETEFFRFFENFQNSSIEEELFNNTYSNESI